MGLSDFTMGKGGNDMVMGQGPFGASYFLRGALAGGICCSLTHGGACPIDVVKTRMQLDPVKYNKGLIGGFRQVIAEEGAMALSTGLGATAQGYFVQGWFKFGGVAAAIISHPADTLLSKVNKAGAGGTGSMMSR